MAIAEQSSSRNAADEDAYDALVVETVRVHASRALAIARRHSLDLEDAQDAFQRGLVQLVRHKHRLIPETAHSWLFQVVRNEAIQVRAQRQRSVAMEDEALERLDGGTTVASVEERVVARDAVWKATEALGALKPDEARALTLQAAGLSYREIAEVTSWSATKVNRALTEGRASFRRRIADLETDAACEAWLPRLSELSSLSVRERAQLRTHLRNCPACRATLRRMHEGQAALRVVLPIALAGADDEAGTGLVARLGDGAARFVDVVLGNLHDRAAVLTIKAQTAAEVVSTGKLAAVAASAAAVAGGGVAVRDASRPATPSRTTAHRAQPRSTASHDAAPARSAPSPTAVASAATPSRTTSTASTPTQRASKPPRTTATTEFASEPSASTATREFGERSSPQATTASKPPAGGISSSGGGSGAGDFSGASSSEFGP